MKKLSRSRFEKARSFLKNSARNLERAWFEYEFESGPIDAVWEALQSFQNEDGGFGHAIEPDFRYTGSSALATTVGLQHLSRLGADADNPQVRRAIQYYRTLSTQKSQGGKAFREKWTISRARCGGTTRNQRKTYRHGRIRTRKSSAISMNSKGW